jgi:hypothetical protein
VPAIQACIVGAIGDHVAEGRRRLAPLADMLAIDLNPGSDAAVTLERVASRNMRGEIAEAGRATPETSDQRLMIERTSSWMNATETLVRYIEWPIAVGDGRSEVAGFGISHGSTRADRPHRAPYGAGVALAASTIAKLTSTAAYAVTRGSAAGSKGGWA